MTSHFFKNPYLYVKSHPESKWRFLLLVISWFFQGVLYADTTERIFKLVLDLFFFLFLYLGLHLLFGMFYSLYLDVMICFILSHSITYLLNSGFLCMFRGTYGVYYHKINYDFNHFINYMVNEVKKNDSIAGLAVYGSYARDELSDASDLDVRILRRRGILNAINACLFCLYLRVKATSNLIPLDLFMIDSTNHLNKMRSDEMPLILYDPSRILSNYYQRER